jgi:hypothetical protein
MFRSIDLWKCQEEERRWYEDMKILEARFRTAKSRKEYEESAKPQRYGARWKIYGFNDDTSMGTGIYLFDDEEAMKAHMVNLREMANQRDHVSNLEMMVWDVQEALSKITGAPI